MFKKLVKVKALLIKAKILLKKAFIEFFLRAGRFQFLKYKNLIFRGSGVELFYFFELGLKSGPGSSIYYYSSQQQQQKQPSVVQNI